MAEAIKVLGQANPAATVLTDLYTVPVAAEAVCSTLIACNRTSGKVDVRLAVAPGGAVDSLEHYIFYDTTIAGNDLLSLTIGISLAANDKVRVYTDTLGVSFSLFGTELS